MLTLAIDTASAACQACVHDSEADRVLGVSVEIIGRGHAERLMAVVDGALDAACAGLSDIDRIGVTVGPGSFTGIRVGVSAARGLALALGCECVGVDSLRALAAGQAEVACHVLAVVDARRGEVYAALFGRGAETVVVPPAAMSPGEAAALAVPADVRLAGSGAPLVAAFLPTPGPPERILSVSDIVEIGVVARLAAASGGPFDPPKPLYLRGADARPQAGFAVARKL